MADKSRREVDANAINLREGDEVVCQRDQRRRRPHGRHVHRGMAIRFQEAEVREVGRDSMGVRGIKLRGDDEGRSLLDVVRDDADLFVVTDTGFGKRVKVERFNRQGRGGQGCRHQTHRGAVSGRGVHDATDDEALLALTGGVLIRNGRCARSPHRVVTPPACA